MKIRTKLTALSPILLTLAIFLTCEPDATVLPVHGDGKYFIDEKGGVVIYRGLNVAGNAKVPDFMPIKDSKLLDPMVDWGVNVIRLLFTWEAYEPEPGEYNREYIGYISNIIDWAWQRKIQVIIDFHQDAFSRYQVNGCGEGFPAWAVPRDVRKDTPDNGSGCKIWGAEMIWDFDMHASWNRFYNDTYGARTRFLQMMDNVSREFGSRPGVLGYDLLNEPWGNEISEIAVLYEDAAKIIRKNDPDSMIFVCPHALISAGNASELPRMSFGNYAYAPHYYDGSIIIFNTWFGTAPDAALDRGKQKSDAWNVPIFWGEFGCDGTANGGMKFLDLFYAWLDRNHASGTQWNYTPGWTPDRLDGFNAENLSIVDNTGALRPNYRIRPYAQRIAGKPVKFEVTRKDTGAVSVHMEWDHDTAKGQTRIFLPRAALFGAAGYTVTASGDSLGCAYDADERYYYCASNSSGRKSVTIASESYK